VGGNQIQVFNLTVENDLPGIRIFNKTFVNAGFHLLNIKARSGRGIGLRICINNQHSLLQHCKAGPQVNGRGGLPDASLLIGNGYNFPHGLFFILILDFLNGFKFTIFTSAA